LVVLEERKQGAGCLRLYSVCTEALLFARKMAATKESTLDELLKKFNLRREDVNKKVTEKHIGKISRSYCKDWEQLPPFLNIESIIKDDINQLSVDGETKRSRFLSKWVESYGSEATYEKLINALLEIRCRSDAEAVCMLIQPPHKTLEPAQSSGNNYSYMCKD
jgi:hypothetical protein